MKLAKPIPPRHWLIFFRTLASLTKHDDEIPLGWLPDVLSPDSKKLRRLMLKRTRREE